MSHLSKIFESAPIKVQNKNGFDLSHLNCGTSKTGQLVPVMCKLLPPNSDFTLGVSMNVNLPPLSVSFYGRVDAIVEGFVIPCSILYGGWKQFIMNQESSMFPASQDSVVSAGGYSLPYFDYGNVLVNDIADCQTLLGTNDNLLEYLGVMPSTTAPSTANEYNLSLLPLLAYHLICDVYYRNKQITKTWFSVNPNVSGSSTAPSGSFDSLSKNVSLIWHSFYVPVGTALNPYGNSASYYLTSTALFDTEASLTFPDGTSIFSTRQRNYARDYFTSSTPTMNRGSNSSLSFDIDTTTETGEFTIGALRAANSLSKFLETNALSSDYAEQMKNRWGTRPIDADFDEPYYLGRVVLPVYQKSVAQTSSVYDSENLQNIGSNSANPFVSGGVMGAKGANGGFSGEGSLCDKYHNSTWSYVMCLFSLVPHAAYGYGLNRELQMLEIGDFPAPELQSVGNEAILSSEVYFNPAFSGDVDFGYIPRYSRFKYIDDTIHGELRPGKTLESFVLQRRLSYSASSDVTIDTDFLQIPQDALDSVFAVSTSSMNLSCWYEIYFKFKVAMPLADFCIPTLGDIADTHTQHTPIGGSRL